MTPSLRSIGLALYTAAILGSGPICMASPVSSSAMASRSNSTYSDAHLALVREARDMPIHSIATYSTPPTPRVLSSRAIPRRNAPRQLSPGDLAELNGSYQRARDRASALRKLNKQAANADPSDSGFQKRYATAAQGYMTTILDLKTVLEKLAADKGLAFFDPSDPLEVLLKNVVNLHKDTLSELVATVQSIPTLGPVLGPILYQLKCIIDEILNITENLSDATLNLLKPIIDPLLGSIL